jgi:hypothetical protein
VIAESSARSSIFMIAKTFIPIPGIRSFAIMRNVSNLIASGARTAG